ncbi:MAG: zinc ribbon domain-containing protein [Halanaerobiales bacterium]
MPIIWLIFVGVVAYYANKKGRNPVGWGLLAVVISPLLAGIALAFVKDLTVEEEIDHLNKKTDNIKREVEHNKEFNDIQREQLGQEVDSIGGSKRTDRLKDENNTEKIEGKIECRTCGEYVSADDKFCFNCGEKVIPAGKKQCPQCEEFIEDDARFCPNCGENFVIRCDSCGEEFEDEVKFCPQCGEELSL